MKEFFEYFAIALLSAACLIVLSKIVMSSFMRKDKDYYEAGERRDEAEMLKNIDYVRVRKTDYFLPGAAEYLYGDEQESSTGKEGDDE